MELNRYPQKDFISDVSQIEFEWNDVVVISDKYDIDVMFKPDDFEKETLKELILAISTNVSKLDNFTQKYSLDNGSSLDAEIGSIYIKSPDLVSFDYWCNDVNSMFDVDFNYKDGQFSLVQFGIKKDLTPVIVD